MTLLDSSLTGTPAVSPDTDLLVLYYLDSPATGLNQVQVFFTFTGGPTNKDTLAGAISFTGAASGSSGFSTVAKSQETTLGTNTTATASVSGTTSGNIVVGMLNTGTGGLSVTSPATNIWTLNNSTHTAGDNAAMGYKASSGGTVGVAFAFTADIWMAMAVEVKAPSTTVFVPKNTYMAPILTQ
jgi:hypothetical protein